MNARASRSVSRSVVAVAVAALCALPLASQEREREKREPGGLASLERRVDIIRMARAAHAEAGRERDAAALERAVHYGEVLLEGAGEQDARAAAEGVPGLDRLAELLRAAADLYRESGERERATACGRLAEYYVARLRGDEAGEQERADERDRAREREGQRERQREREGQRESGVPDGDIGRLEHRIEILRFARAAWAEAERREQAAYLERFIHVAELQLEGAGERAIRDAFEGMTIGNIIELLHGARDLYAEWGNAKRAAACRRLARFYTERERSGESAAARTGRGPDLEDKEARLEILHVAMHAHQEAGHGDAVDLLERAIKLSRLQLEGASDAAISRAAEGLTIEQIIDLVRRAEGLYREWGNAERAGLCKALADYYVRRSRGDESEEAGEEGERRERGEGDEHADEARTEELLERLERLERELEEIRALLRRRLGR